MSNKIFSILMVDRILLFAVGYVEVDLSEVEIVNSKVDKTLEKLRASGVKVTRASDMKPRLEFVPSGSILLDKHMGTSGYPIPKYIHVWGTKSSGKSLLTLISAGYVTRSGYGVIYYDGEDNFQQEELKDWPKKLGVNMDHFFDISGKQGAEDVLDTVITLLQKHPEYFKMVIIDPIGALTSKRLQGKDTGDGYIEDNPKMVSQFCRKLNIINTSAVVFMLSHIGAPIGTNQIKPQPKGGNSVQHWSSISLEISGSLIPESRNEFGFASQQKININVAKNKVGRPGGIVKDLLFDFNLGGFDTMRELIQLSVASGLIRLGAGGHYSIPDTTIKAHGELQMKAALEANTEIAHWLFKQVTGFTFQEYFNYAPKTQSVQS